MQQTAGKHLKIKGLMLCGLCAVLCLGNLLAEPPAEAVPAENARKGQSPRTGLLIPAYIYPENSGRHTGLDDWQKIWKAADHVPVTAIINPASGPGKRAEAVWLKVVGECEKKGVRTIGYVSTRYGKRPVAEVKQDIDLWVKHYPAIQGFFFDEQASEVARLDYYAEVATYARAQVERALIVTNPGTVCDEAYVARDVCDIVCIFEQNKGLEHYKAPEWTSRYAPGRFYGLAYEVPEKGLQESLKAGRQHFGYLYITDDQGANPWDRLPKYWDAEVKALAE